MDDAAAAALIGAGVGAVGTGVVTLALEVARWRREDLRARRAMTAAARLVSAEFATVEALAAASAKHGSAMPMLGVSTKAWDALGVQLAEALPPADYLAVVNAAVKIQATASTSDQMRVAAGESADDIKRAAAGLVQSCTAAREVLGQYVGAEGVPVWRDHESGARVG